MTPRPIDHLVLPVAGLAAARARLAALGFLVAPDAHHPFGTGNACVFFRNRTYLEPLAFLRPDLVRESIERGLVFVDRLDRFRKTRGEGFAMAAFRSADAEADRAAFAAAGFALGDLFHFSRMATRPDGSRYEIGVALAFAADERAPHATVFACQPIGETVNTGTSFVDHPNTATGVTGFAGVAANPADFHVYLEAATGERELRCTSLGVEARTGCGSVRVLTPIGYEARFGVSPPDPGDGLLLAAIEIDAADPVSVERHAGAAARRHGGLLVVPPAPGLGALVAFGAA